jgi:hypothetical protein
VSTSLPGMSRTWESEVGGDGRGQGRA